MIGNIRNIFFFKPGFFFADLPNLFKSELIKEFADRLDDPRQFSDLFTGYGKSGSHLCQTVYIIAHGPYNFGYHSEEKALHIFIKRLSAGIKPRHIFDDRGIHIYFCVFRIKSYRSHRGRAAYDRSAGNIVKHISFFADHIADIMHMRVPREHTVQTGICEDLSGRFMISLHIALTNDGIKR